MSHAANALILNSLFTISACNGGTGNRTIVSRIRRTFMVAKVSPQFEKQVAGYGLTTAEILYRRPDHRWLLQSYLWQEYDLFPEFPELKRFLAFWEEKLEGPLHSVTVAHQKLIKPAELRTVSGLYGLH
jgi:uncharacterized protein Usg